MRFAADENFNGKILDSLKRRLPEIEIVRVQDTELYQSSDSEILAWAAQQERILLTHDVQTLVDDAYARVRAGLPMPGVIHVSATISIGDAVDELEVLIGAGTSEDFDSQVKHVPLR
jgi:predicted nuclease of predicted toxin-antitoxin system